MNMNLADNVNKILQMSAFNASKTEEKVITIDIFMISALSQDLVIKKFSSFDIAKVKNELNKSINWSEITSSDIIPGKKFINMLENIYNKKMAQKLSENVLESNEITENINVNIDLWDIFLYILNDHSTLSAELLNSVGITASVIKRIMSQDSSFVTSKEKDSVNNENGEEKLLAKFTTNLNERAAQNKIDSLIGREFEINRTAQILSRRRKNNPLLVGEPGVGKTAVAEGLAKMINDGTAPDALKDKVILSLNMATLVAGCKFRGDFEQRLISILDEIKQSPDVILFIDEIHTMIGVGASGNNEMDASNIMKPALANGDLRVIGATTFQEYRKIFEKEAALNRRFQKVDVNEPSPSETVQILSGLKKTFEDYHNVKYTKDAIEAAVALSIKYIPDRFLPDKAIDLLDEAGSAQKLLPESQRKSFIDKQIIEETIASVTRIPVAQVSEDDKSKLMNLDSDLRSQIFGQDEAIDKLSEAVWISKAGLNDAKKPLGSFLFTGPTGVGKTEVVNQMSEILNMPLIRFDMSEYMDKHNVSRLVGAPPGYIGHEDGGLLTDAVAKNQHSIILFDEIEKAHPDVLNILLQVLDYGSLTDTKGRTVNFKNTYIVMTTNAGAVAAQKSSVGFVKVDHKEDGTAQMNKMFSPEFRNRIDAIVTFNSLGMNEILKIVDKNINKLNAPLNDKGVTLIVTDEVRQKFAQDGFDPSMGARPMARLIQDRLKKPLAQKMLFGDLTNGGSVTVDLNKNGELDFIVNDISEVVTKTVSKKTTRKKTETSLKKVKIA